MAVSFALLGAGKRAQQYVLALKNLPGGTLSAICGQTRPLAENLARRNGMAAYTDIRQMLTREKVNAAIVATPDFTHGTLVPDLLTAGVHVLVEKPLAMTWTELQKVEAALSHRSGLLLVLANPYLYCVSLQQLLSSLKKEKKDALLSVEAEWNLPFSYPARELRWSYMTSPMFHLLPPLIDFSIAIAGSFPQAVFATGSKGRLLRIGINTEDWVLVVLRFANGPATVLRAGWTYAAGHPMAHRKKLAAITHRSVLEVDLFRDCQTEPSIEASQEKNYEVVLLRHMLADFIEKIGHPKDYYETVYRTVKKARLLLAIADALEKRKSVTLNA